MKSLSSADVWRLLHKKYVAVLGDSIQRSINKNLVKVLQNDDFRTAKQLKGKGDMSFANDTRYHEQSLQMYKTNMDHLFIRLTEVLSTKCLLLCNTSMSVGFKAGEVLEYPIPNVRWDIIEGNFYSTTLADLHQLDVIDLHLHLRLRFKLRSRVKDATHSTQLAHQKYTCILMAHIE
uniref:Uncharacterized protein n=1 Tax=Pyxicephalus adspersus TaxID=30357 RepID=A0AAV3AE25_PYXAD|nr:TPA: hypothetical protein GDO54_018130 [Pyxicephalus adspersus]